ncbi:alpha-glucosidase [Nocardioides sp.]|uniref:alpha-glucosidase n=1 Tax=Nocardioides sp. TaxID=35761 RepID=UPI0026021233|nr:alpha-glucosidase [Nocardioides sp.]MDI6911968.1 alpha-glucosidase [Nocardioides sp.]
MPPRRLPVPPALTLALSLALALAVPGSLQAAAPSAPAARAAAVPADLVDTVTPGGLDVAPGAVGTWTIGDLAVDVGLDTGLSVRAGGRTVWVAPPAGAFVTGGRGSVSWEENRGYFWPTVSYTDRLPDQSVDTVVGSDASVVLTGRLSGAAADDASYTLTVRPRPAGGAALVVTTSAATPLTSVALVSGRSAHAGVHGFGEQFTDFDLDGRLLPIVDREQGVGRGEEPITSLADLTNHGAGGTRDLTYAAWPSFVTDDLRGLRLDAAVASSTAFAVADTRDPDAVSLELWSPSLSAQASAAATPARLVTAQQAGDRRRPLAGWATRGAIVGLQGGTQEVRRELGRLLDAGANVSGVWIQDWTGKRTTSFGDRLWWTWQLDRSRYPGWGRLVRGLADQGITTTTYVNPFLVDAAPKGDRSIRNLWAEARDRGFLVTDDTGAPYALDQGEFEASLVDLTDPAARSWYADVIARYVLADGVRGFMADFAEGLPFDAHLHAGSPATLHNRWPTLWARTVRAACRRAEQPRCVTWFRSGALGQAAHAPLFWNGDQLVTFGREDGLASALLGTLSAGVSGWPLVHSDIGGYTSVNAVVKDYVRTPELLARWAEYQAFGVVMRTHEGNRPAANPQVFSTRATARAFAHATRIFGALTPYRDRVVRAAARTGVPAMRPVWLVAPDSRAAASETEFLLGRQVLVAPVLAAGATSVRVAFPPGRWVHLITGREYAGDRTEDVSAPVGRPAAFVRADGPWSTRLPARFRAAGLDHRSTQAR